MKKRRTAALIAFAAATVFTAALIFAACAKDDGVSTRRRTALDADSYVDYASTVFLDTERYPQLADQGLKLVIGYGDDYDAPFRADGDDEEVIAQHFDPSKNIMVLVHGLQIGYGRRTTIEMCSENRLEELRIIGAEGEADYFASDANSAQTYDLAKYWHDNGYNVFYFHYEKFADHVDAEGNTDTIGSPFAVSDRIWSRDTGAQAVLPDGTLTEPGAAIGGYSLAELFAAEYLRAVDAIDKLYPEYKSAGRDIRCAGHSMGGVLSVAGNMLLNLLCESGAADRKLIPARLDLMDSYIGIGGTGNIAWSGKPHINDKCGDTYVTALEQLTLDFGVAAVFYANKGYAVPFQFMTDWNPEKHRFDDTPLDLADYGDYANRIIAVAPFVSLEPAFAGVGEVVLGGHNAVFEWVLTSVLYEPPTVAVGEDEAVVPTAAVTNAQVIAARGTFWKMTASSNETVRCDDDVFSTDTYVPAA